MNDKNNLFLIVKNFASELNSKYTDNGSCRADLLNFMSANEWFGMEYIVEKDAAYIEMINENIITRLKLWLKAYASDAETKINLLLEYHTDIYPKTCFLYKTFMCQEKHESKDVALKLLDYLLYEIKKEITEYSEDEIQALLKKMYKEVQFNVINMFKEFIQFKHNGKQISRWKYSIVQHERYADMGSSYEMKTFSAIAYYVFNDMSWKKNELIKKALHSEKYAKMWLAMAFTLICGLRGSDIKRLPVPKLPYDRDMVIEKLLDGSFSKDTAVAITEELCLRLKLQPMTPSKTSEYSNIPNIKLFVPESIKEPLGVIIAILLTHYDGKMSTLFKTEDKFTWTLQNLRIFYGEKFVGFLNQNRFSVQRANKSYLQGIESITPDDGSNKAKGYMLAAIARSHKQGYGKLPDITEIYLKDARFSGYSPEFIVKQMFERGIFSFIPAILLEILFDKQYFKLPVQSQTSLIKQVGLSALQIENIITALEKALKKSREIVHSVVLNNDDDETIYSIIQGIASGNAVGRSSDCLCLRTAAGMTCPNPERDSCIGCGYEIYTKATLHLLIKEYGYMLELKQTAKNETDKMRYKNMLNNAVCPAIYEIIYSAKKLYSPEDAEEILSVIERGIKNAGSLQEK